MATGQFYKSGGQLFTTYEATSEGCKQLINDFYNGGYAAFYGGFARSTGYPQFDGGFGYSGGMFNPKFGMDVTAAMFTSNSVSAALGKRAYDHEGMRLVTQFAAYGVANEFVVGDRNVFQSQITAGDLTATSFLGLGAGTVADGQIMDSVGMDYDMIRIPYKELPLPYDYGLGLKALEGKDDTSSYKQYIDLIGKNYADLMDKTILRPFGTAQPRPDVKQANGTYAKGTQETSLNGLARIFSSGTEVAAGDNIESILPWGGLKSDMKGGYQGQMTSGQGRTTGITYDQDTGAISGTNTHTQNNYDAQVVDAAGAVPSLTLFDQVYMQCLTNWEGDYDQKFWILSPLMWNKLNQLGKANNIYLDTVWTTMSLSGIKTPQGRDFGFALKSYQNIPIIMSGNLAYNYVGKTVNTAQYGDAFLIDGKHAWVCVTSPTEVWTIENPAITRDLREQTITHMRAEVRADKFITSGRLKNVGASA